MMKLKLTNLTDHFRENTTGPENSLDAACIQLCGEFPTLFESTLGCLKDFSLDIRFKPELNIFSRSQDLFRSQSYKI